MWQTKTCVQYFNGEPHEERETWKKILYLEGTYEYISEKVKLSHDRP
jgi:hypothetical protein